MIPNKTLRDKKNNVTSEINVSSVKGQAFFPSNTKQTEKYFYIVKKD